MFGKLTGIVFITALAAAAPRKTAPDFAAVDATGAHLHLANYRGRVVLLNFWATWCGGCRVEIPWLTGFASEFKNRGFAVIGVSMDDGGWKAVRPFLEAKKTNYPVILGNSGLADTYGVPALPATFLIDRNGRVAASHTGLPDRSALENEIRRLLDEPVKTGISARTAPGASGLPRK